MEAILRIANAVALRAFLTSLEFVLVDCKFFASISSVGGGRTNVAVGVVNIAINSVTAWHKTQNNHWT